MLKFMLTFFSTCRKIALIGFGAFLGAVFEYGFVAELVLGLALSVALYYLSDHEFCKTGEMLLNAAKKQADEEDDT